MNAASVQYDRGACGEAPRSVSALAIDMQPAANSSAETFVELPSRDGKRTERVADYILQDVLGTGSFGQVVLAVHR